MRSPFISALLGLGLVACRVTPASAPPIARYIVNTTPIDVPVVSGGLCLAIDPTDPRGVWWWEPGRAGCSSRSTGPGVFRADQATVVAPTRSGPIEVRFRLPLIVGPGSTTPDFADVGLVFQDGGLRAASGARVPTVRRKDLEVPESPKGP